MSTGQQNVPIRRERLAANLIILCGFENFVGIGEIVRIFCKS
jgi:hypothetical protein